MKSLYDQIAGKCIHFNGIQNTTCQKGMHYDQMDAALPLPYRPALPCRKPDAKALERLGHRSQCSCPHVEFPSDEVVKKEIEEIGAAVKKMSRVEKLLEPFRKSCTGTGGSGLQVCPVCNGKLHWSIAGCNGHARVRCETEGCVCWIE